MYICKEINPDNNEPYHCGDEGHGSGDVMADGDG